MWLAKVWFGLIIIGIVLAVLEKILNLNGLMLRAWVRYVQIISFVLAISITICKYFFNSYRKIMTKNNSKRRKIGIALGMVGVAIISTILFLYGTIDFVFSYEPEHIVIKYNQKMVAYVDSGTEVHVEYYPYKNIFICGNQELVNEWYGNGGYDPLEKGCVAKPKTYSFYNEEGKLINEETLKE